MPHLVTQHQAAPAHPAAHPSGNAPRGTAARGVSAEATNSGTAKQGPLLIGARSLSAAGARRKVHGRTSAGVRGEVRVDTSAAPSPPRAADGPGIPWSPA
jgi:hypothetical protein